MRHFLTLFDRTPAELAELLQVAREVREERRSAALQGRVLALLFQKHSTRTRVALEAGMAQLGGSTVFLGPGQSQLDRGETLEDTARVLSRMVDVVALRLRSHADLKRFAAASAVPVVNALTDAAHPCQLLADMLTFEDHRGPIAGRRVAWVGDGNNVCRSYLRAAVQLGFELVVACPEGFEPPSGELGSARVVRDPREAVEGAELVATDAWVSMGDEDAERRKQALRTYQVNAELLAAGNNPLFLHCLPAHRGEEVTADVLDASVVFEQAENRLHTHKALLLSMV